MNPVRVQRRRTRGWRAPDGAVYVGRGSRWGNPWLIHDDGRFYTVQHAVDGRTAGSSRWLQDAHWTAANVYRTHLQTDPELAAQARALLAGRDLMCWCALDLDCHADVLLELANQTAEKTTR
ncbi:DUF4326 domain-containing protein [Kitasatospora sp. NPDC090091]|uniref:DUF4326 domain-containing protein n=1 Tax=Kitasatospora sp. NPDC090091 TaxID=3364081 RepID=UPI0038124623